jgi:L-asparaginase II
MAKIKDEVIARMKALAPLNFEKAAQIGLEFDLKQRSIVAGAKRNGIEYVNKVRVSKTGEPVVTKEDLVKEIAKGLGVDVKVLDGLEKATKTALVAVAKGFDEPEVDEDEGTDA